VWQDDVPRVVVGPRKPWRGASVINLDNDLLQAKALDYLKNQGKKRIAVVCNISNTRPFEEMWQHCNQMMQERGLKTKPYWIQGVNLHAAGWTTNLIHLLFSDANQEQPDGLMILDDNLVEPVAVGVKRAGIKVSEDLTIVAHTNFPEISNAAVPLKRIGFDMCELVRTAQRIISCQRRNPDAEPEKVVLKPVFEHELTAACN
jgi:DNA-binding LacI/PurR family transcriptional regulator